MEYHKDFNPFAVAKMRRKGFTALWTEEVSKVNDNFPPIKEFWEAEAKKMTAKDFENQYLSKPRTEDGISHLLADAFFIDMLYPEKKGLKYNWKNIKEVWEQIK